MRKLLFTLIAFGSLSFFTSCSDDDDNGGADMDEMNNPSLSEAAQSAGLTTLLDAVLAIDGLAASLESTAEITVFAPNNAAFAQVLEHHF